MSRKVTPSLESITVRGKYNVPETDFGTIEKKITEALSRVDWFPKLIMAESLELLNIGCSAPEMINRFTKNAKEATKVWHEQIKKVRYGAPLSLSIIAIEHTDNSTLLEVQCRPAMWYKMTILREQNFTENDVQEALLECRVFVKRVMSILRGREVEPVAVYPIIQKMEIKSRLLNLGLNETVNHLDDAEKHIVQNNFPESLTSSRTAFEKMIDWQMKKRGLEKTSNYKNDLDRLRSRGHIDLDTTTLLQSYYHCLSTIGVHEKGVPPGFYEAQMGYGITLIVLDYFANKLP